MIYLRDITPENWRPGLSVSEEQKGCVSDSAGILARAYAYRNFGSRAFVIYFGELPVGMAMYYETEELKAYNFSQFFIDRRYQKKGYGYAAASMILDMMRRDGKYSTVLLCYIEGDEPARKLYEKLGFFHTGERDGNEIVMKCWLK